MNDSTITRNAMPRPGSPLWTYLVTVIGAGALVLGYALTGFQGPDIEAIAHDPVFWILGCFIVVGELRPIITPGSTENTGATTSTTFSFAALLYSGLPLAVLLQATAVLTAGLVRRRAWHRNVFNAAQYTLSVGAAAMVLKLFGVRACPAAPWVPEGDDLLAIALAGAVYFLANDLLVCGAVALHERVPLLKTLRIDFGKQVLVHLALLGLAPLIVISMDRSAAFVPLIVLPFIAVYLNASMLVRREHQALHDVLTGLPNRKLLSVRSREALADRRGEAKVGLFLLDLDRFKEVNDTLGHATGDRLLRLVAHRLQLSVRPGDLVARLGGDEFAVLLPTVRDAPAACEVARRLRAALGEPIRLDGMTFEIEASVGIALHPDHESGHASEFAVLLQRADVAMYVAKESRSGVELYTPAKDRNSTARLGMLGDLRRGVDRGELELAYQPKIALADGSPAGMEALLRWRHPEHGLLGPRQFLPAAEQTYLIKAITRHVVETALDQVDEWWRAGLKVPVAVNISGRDLLDGGLSELIGTGLLARRLPPAALRLEITERIMAGEPVHTAESLGALAGLGVEISLDDFGTGYSPLAGLRRLPVTEIKIDTSLITAMRSSADDTVIVRSVVELMRTLGFRSVAEGVEDRGTAEVLRDMGCDQAQGHYFGEPMDGPAATAWLRARVRRAAEPVRPHAESP